MSESTKTEPEELQSFDIGLMSGLLDPKHVRNIGPAIWLYVWCIRRMTRIDEASRLGYVLGGQPITYETIKTELGLPWRTYMRYVDILREHGYIVTTRTPHGLKIAVTKAKKRYDKNGITQPSDMPESTYQEASDMPESAKSYDKNGISNIRDIEENINTYAQIFEKLKNIIQPAKPGREGVKYTEAYGKLVKKALKTYSEDELIVSATFFVSQFNGESEWHTNHPKFRTLAQFLGNTKDRIPRYQLCYEQALEASEPTNRITIVSDEEIEAKRQEQTA